jgi:TonB family protein
VPKPTNPGGEGSPSRPNGTSVLTCISGCVTNEYNYPSAAREEGREGEVELICDIDPNGKTSNVRILTPSKYNDLNKAAIKILQGRKYAPLESGILGERITITFDLTD